MRGLPDGSAGLPRRCAPRNDKGGKWRAGTLPLGCRVAALLAMTTGGTGLGGVGRVPVFGYIPTTLSLRAR